MGKRVLSGIVLMLLLVPLFLAGGRVFTIAVGIISLLAFKELMDLKESHSKIPNGILLVSICALLFLVFYDFDTNGGVPYIIIAILSLIFLLPTLFQYKSGEYETKDAFYLIGVLAFLGMAFHSVLVLRNDNFYFLIYLILIPIATDVFSFLIGKTFGKRKIAPVISPNKTVAGSIWGSIFGTIVPTICYYFLISKENILMIMGLSFTLSVFGQLGDLLFSKIKRENHIKDFSNLIPGHGGVLDRFDSFIFVILTFMILKGFIG